MRRAVRVIVPLLALGALAGGCGSSKPKAGGPAVVPAKTQREWLDRLVGRFLRPLNNDLRVVNGLATPQGKLYLQTGNEESITVVKNRMTDLSHCSERLARVGPAPDVEAPLDRVQGSFAKACPYYEQLAGSILRSVPLLSSDDPADQATGNKEFAKASAPSRAAARHFGEGIRLLEQNGLLARYQGG